MAQPTDRGVAVDRPAVDLGLRDVLRDILEGGLGHLAAIDQPTPGLRQRDADEPAAAFDRCLIYLADRIVLLDLRG